MLYEELMPQSGSSLLEAGQTIEDILASLRYLNKLCTP